MKRVILFLILCVSVLPQVTDLHSIYLGGVVSYAPQPNKILVGISGGILRNNLYGFYASFKGQIITTNQDIVYENIDYQQAKNYFGDAEKGVAKDLYDFSIGLAFPVLTKIYLNVGVNYQLVAKYTEFYDHFHILGDKGKYYCKSESEDGFGLDFLILFITDEKNNISFGATAGKVPLVSVGFNWGLF